MLSNIIRGIGHGVSSVGRAVQAASQKLDQTVAGTPPPAPAPQVGPPAPTPAPEPAPKGFQLPDLGPGPDANAPEYQGDEGKKKYESDLRDYQHKQDIHQAFTDLDKTFTEANPTRDYQKEYQDQVAMLKAHEAERPQGSNLARAALALGDFNPAVQQSGRSNLDTYNANVESDAQRSDASFAQRMMLKQKMHESAAADAAQQGNWKKALAENEKAALLKADTEALQHKYEMEKTTATQTGANERAQIRADAMKKVAQTRAGAIASAHGLSGSFMTTFEKEAAKQVAKLLGPQDLTKEYTQADLDGLTTYLEGIAEMLHDQQYGDGSSGTYLGTHPSKRPKPKPTTKEQF
jgi:hypothetical protein